MILRAAKKIVRQTKAGREALRVLRPVPMEHRMKSDITSFVGRILGLRTYLEISATATGNYYRNVDRDHFTSVQRIVYRAEANDGAGHVDGLPVDYLVMESDLSGAFADIRAKRRVPDVVLVDSFHTYQETWRDLTETFELVPDGGVLVVHDCLPPGEEFATPDWREGEWYGVSYAAFLDFVLTQTGFDYLTVDCDSGCGVIAKGRELKLPKASDGALPPRPGEAAVQAWLGRDRDDYGVTWQLFQEHKDELLRLVRPVDFFSGLSARKH